MNIIQTALHAYIVIFNKLNKYISKKSSVITIVLNISVLWKELDNLCAEYELDQSVIDDFTTMFKTIDMKKHTLSGCSLY